MVLDPIPQSLPVPFFGSRPQPPTSPSHARAIFLSSSLAKSAVFGRSVRVVMRAHTFSRYKYGVATISRLLKVIGRFCKTALRKWRYHAKETGAADQWVLKGRECSGFARVNKVTSASLGYPLSVFNKNSTLKPIIVRSILIVATQ